MRKASTILTAEQTRQINQAIGEAESHTSAEIVPVIATASGRYDRAEDIAGLWLGVIAAIIVWFTFPQTTDDSGTWGGISPPWKLAAIVAATVVGFVIGAVVASNIGWLRRLFTPRQQMRDEVELKARSMFFDNRVHRTAGATGLLLYVSLYERMATVAADEAVVKKVGQAALNEICSKLTSALKKSGLGEAICESLKEAGQALGPVLPRAEDDVNELPDALVTID